MNIYQAIRKLKGSSVVWGWLATVAGLGFSLITVPLMLHYLPPADVGAWYVFNSLGGFAFLTNLGFGQTIFRNAGYLWVGADKLEKNGLSQQKCSGSPNWTELAKLIRATNLFYSIITGVALLLLLSLGTFWIARNCHELENLHRTYLCWYIYSLGIVINLFSIQYVTFIEGIGNIRISQKFQLFCRLVNVIAVSCLVPVGFGLMGLAAGAFLSSVLMFILYFLNVRKTFKPVRSIRTTRKEIISCFSVIWPNTWKFGLSHFGYYTITNSGTLICNHFFGLRETAQYGLTVQAIRICTSIAGMWTVVVTPLINQLRSVGNIEGLRKTFTERLAWAFITFWTIAIAGSFLGPVILRLIDANVQLLPPPLMLFIALYLYLEYNHSWFITLIISENRVPTAPAFLLSGAAIILAGSALAQTGAFGIWSVLLAQAAIQAAYNNWHWVIEGIKVLKLSRKVFIKSWFSYLSVPIRAKT